MAEQNSCLRTVTKEVVRRLDRKDVVSPPFPSRPIRAVHPRHIQCDQEVVQHCEPTRVRIWNPVLAEVAPNVVIAAPVYEGSKSSGTDGGKTRIERKFLIVGSRV